MESRKMVLKIYLQGNSVETYIENRHKYGERGGEGEMYGKSNMETYITICNLGTNGNLLYGSGNSNRGSLST